MIQVLLDVERFKVHRAIGVRSLFAYAVEILGLSESVAYAFIHVARKTREVPALKLAIEAQSLSVSKAGRIVSSLNIDNAAELISFSSTHTCKQIDAEVAKRNPKAAVRETVKHISEDVIQVTFSFSKSEYEKLERVRALEAQKQKSSKRSEAVVAGLDCYLKHNDPVQKAERAQRRKAAKKLCANKVLITQPSPSMNEESNRASLQYPGARTPLTAEQKHAVNLRDKGRCTHIDCNGKRCNEDQWTQIHHIAEVSRGGTNDPENLTTLCWHHHDLVHQLSLPIEGQVTWLRSPRVAYG